MPFFKPLQIPGTGSSPDTLTMTGRAAAGSIDFWLPPVKNCSPPSVVSKNFPLSSPSPSVALRRVLHPQ
jgi:hypothetical protein